MPARLKKSVVGEIYYRSPVRNRLIRNDEFIVCGKLIGHFHLQRAGKASVAIGRDVPQHYLAVIALLCIPYRPVKSFRPSMQGVAAVVQRQHIFMPLQEKPSVRYPVGISSHSGTQERLRTVYDVVYRVMSQKDVGIVPVPVGKHNGRHHCPVVSHGNLRALPVMQKEQAGALSVYFLDESISVET